MKAKVGSLNIDIGQSVQEAVALSKKAQAVVITKNGDPVALFDARKARGAETGVKLSSLGIQKPVVVFDETDGIEVVLGALSPRRTHAIQVGDEGVVAVFSRSQMRVLVDEERQMRSASDASFEGAFLVTGARFRCPIQGCSYRRVMISPRQFFCPTHPGSALVQEP